MAAVAWCAAQVVNSNNCSSIPTTNISPNSQIATKSQTSNHVNSIINEASDQTTHILNPTNSFLPHHQQQQQHSQLASSILSTNFMASYPFVPPSNPLFNYNLPELSESDNGNFDGNEEMMSRSSSITALRLKAREHSVALESN
jgi:hypothetical protein